MVVMSIIVPITTAVIFAGFAPLATIISVWIKYREPNEDKLVPDTPQFVIFIYT